MLSLKNDGNGRAIQVVGYDPKKTINTTIPALGNVIVDTTNDVYFNIIKKEGDVTTEMESDGNKVSLLNYYVSIDLNKIKVNNEYVVNIENENIGTGDGSNIVFNLINKPIVSDSETVYDSGTAVAKDQYTINYTTGEINFNTAPVSGDAITANYTYGKDNTILIFRA